MLSGNLALLLHLLVGDIPLSLNLQSFRSSLVIEHLLAAAKATI